MEEKKPEVQLLLHCETVCSPGKHILLFFNMWKSILFYPLTYGNAYSFILSHMEKHILISFNIWKRGLIITTTTKLM
jgi:hypothetical protein